MVNRFIRYQHGVVYDDTDVDTFVPSSLPGSTSMIIENYPDDHKRNPPEDYGSWIFYVPHTDLVETFRKTARLMRERRLCHSLRVNTEGEHKEASFALSCHSHSNLRIIRKVAETLLSEGLLEKYGDEQEDGTKTIFFKSSLRLIDDYDDLFVERGYLTALKGTKHESLLDMFKYTTKKELFVKEFNEGKTSTHREASWKIVSEDANPSIVRSFESYMYWLEDRFPEP